MFFLEKPKDGRKEDDTTPRPSIPGEGVCRYGDKVFENNQKIDPRTELLPGANETSKYSDPCIEYCFCIASVSEF